MTSPPVNRVSSKLRAGAGSSSEKSCAPTLLNSTPRKAVPVSWQSSESEYQVSNSVSGVELVVRADFSAHTIGYDYRPLGNKRGGIPEGGILSMRERQPGVVEFYSSDEKLTPEETRQIVLEPVLFPPQLAA